MTDAIDSFNELNELIQSGEPQSAEHRRAGQLIKRRLAQEPQCAWALAALAELQFRLASAQGPITLDTAGATALRAIAAQTTVTSQPESVGLNAVNDAAAGSGSVADSYLSAPYLTLAKLHLEYRQAAEAMAWVHRAMKLPHARTDVLFVLARIAQIEQRWDDAKVSYQHCLDTVMSPQRRSNVLCWLADLLLQSKPSDIDGARAASAQAISLTPDSLAKQLRHAELLLSHTRDYADGLACAKRVLKLSDGELAGDLVALAQYGLWAAQVAGASKGFQFGGSAGPQRGSLAGLSIADAMVLAAQRPAAGIIVDALLASGQIININYLEPNLGRTALVGAAIANNLPLARTLVGLGASVHSLDRATGRNALFWFAVHDNVDAVRLLHARGSDCHLLDTSGLSVVAAARAAAGNEEQRHAANAIAQVCEYSHAQSSNIPPWTSAPFAVNSPADCSPTPPTPNPT
jgi:tetratricopeptide (TPR) repeat protein